MLLQRAIANRFHASIVDMRKNQREQVLRRQGDECGVMLRVVDASATDPGQARWREDQGAKRKTPRHSLPWGDCQRMIKVL